MADTKSLLTLKKSMKAKIPSFRRSNATNRAKISRSSWRKPKGLHNKMKDHKRGKRAMPNIGFRTPVALRNTDMQGRALVNVATLEDLKALDSKTNVAVISRRLGGRKAKVLLDEAAKMGIAVHAVKDPKAKAQTLEDAVKKRKEASAAKAKARDQKKEAKKPVSEKEKKKQAAAAKKAEEKSSNDKSTKDEAKDEKKKELDKILTQKE